MAEDQGCFGTEGESEDANARKVDTRNSSQFGRHASLLHCYFFTAHTECMNMHALVLAHTCAHTCIVVHMDVYIILIAYSQTLKYTVHLHIPDGYPCMVYNKPVW